MGDLHRPPAARAAPRGGRSGPPGLVPPWPHGATSVAGSEPPPSVIGEDIKAHIMSDDKPKADLPPSSPAVSGRERPVRAAAANGHSAARSQGVDGAPSGDEPALGWVIETIFSPFHCLYQDALFFHNQSRLA